MSSCHILKRLIEPSGRFLVRFKNAIASYPELAQLVKCLSQKFWDWHSAIVARPEAFGDPFKGLQPSVRGFLLRSIKEKVDRLTSILDREEGKLLDSKEKKDRNTSSSAAYPQDALIDALHTTYEGPGQLREKGPRHDNDFEDIYKIRIAPTNEELLCRLPPFLPANIFGAPHPAPPGSMLRLLDIQFRLLREELTYAFFSLTSIPLNPTFLLKCSIANGYSTSL